VDVCRRDGAGAARRSEFVRLPVPAGADRRAVRLLLADHAAEPVVRAGGPSWAAARLLAGRLGTTFSVADLGSLHAGGMIRSAAFHPVVSGPAGVAFGVVGTERTTTLTVRARRRDFSPTAVAVLLDAFAAVLPAPQPVADRPSATAAVR
jgi:hypothetical protein